MKFCWSTITAKNMEKSLWFYQEIVGLSVKRKFSMGPGHDIVFLGDGEIQIELISDVNNKAPGNIEGISLGFEVDSVDDMIGFLKEKGVDIQSGPFQPNPHVRFIYVKDPDGVNVQFVQNM